MMYKILATTLFLSFLLSPVAEALSPTEYKRRINPARYAAFQIKKENIKTRNALRTKLQNQEQEYSERVLIIAAHPDDEILCCSNAIKAALLRGAAVTVVFITDGDAKVLNNPKVSKAYGRERRKESQTAGKLMGLERENLIFLNFPDGLLSALGDTMLRSPYTGQERTNAGSHYPNIRYTQKNLKQKLTSILTHTKPTAIYIPSELRDKHDDHQATGRIMKTVIKEKRLATFPDVFEYAIHGQGINREALAVDETKLSLIQVFQSQMHDLAHEAFLENFAYITETFTNWKTDWLTQKGE